MNWQKLFRKFIFTKGGIAYSHVYPVTCINEGFIEMKAAFTFVMTFYSPRPR
jgi:hypothetical protein